MADEAPCCPVFDPVPWEGKYHEWRDKPFLRDSIPQLFHNPLPWVMKRKVTRLWDRAKKAGIAPDLKDFLLLAYDPSPWKSELYMTVTEAREDPRTEGLSGRFWSRVFDGPYLAVPRYYEEILGELRSRGEKPGKTFFYFTTCPKCAKKYGHNYIVALSELAAP
jgi:hypothetical protein